MRAGIEVQGLKELLKDMNRLGPAFSREVRVASKKIATDEVPRLKSAANSSDKLSAAVGVTVRARSDRVPSIVAGGAKRVAVSTKPKAGDVFFGAEFGGGKRKTTRQFRPHQGKRGYWFWPQIREDEKRMVAEWLAAVERVLEDQTMIDRGN